MRRVSLCAALAAVLMACGDDGGVVVGNEEEVITTVTLSFVPAAGGSAFVFAFDDPDGDGGGAPTIDEVELAAGSYTLAIELANGLEDPPEDITEEVADESDSHQLFFTGNAPLDISYADVDINGLPVGLNNEVVASSGAGQLTVTLRHLPPIGSSAVKVAGLEDEVASSGFSAIGGTTDVQVTFDVTVP